MINEKDQNAYHVRWTHVKVNPADPTHPVIKTEVKTIRKSDWKYFTGTTEAQIRRQKIVGVEGMEIVHDPTIEKRQQLGSPIQFTKIEKVTDEQKVTEARESELSAKIERNANPLKRRNTRKS